MKHILIFIFCFTNYNVFCQKLNFADKKEWRKNLKQMLKDDQFYRSKISKQNILSNDSLWILQSKNDSINKEKFVQLTNKFGYPSLKRIGNQNSVVLILHFTLEKDFVQLFPLFNNELKKGNMPSLDYAIWFDRCQIMMKKSTFYGAYGKKTFCSPELEEINEKRSSIGLEKLLADPNCK
jgi:hypothetical protein